MIRRSVVSALVGLLPLLFGMSGAAEIPVLAPVEFQAVYQGKEVGVTTTKLSRFLSFTEVRNVSTISSLSRTETENFSVSFFNVEQGRRLADLRMMARRVANRETVGVGELNKLFGADVILINEADWGTCRSGFQNVAEKISEDLKVNFAFGTEFLEVQPERVGLVQGNGTGDCKNPQYISSAPQVTGNAILSRHPIRSIKRIELPRCHDWFLEQRDGRFLTEERQIRRGGRMALVGRIDLPGGNAEDLVVVSTHLENKAWPNCRRFQLEYLLKQLRSESLPIVTGGDLNVWGGLSEAGLFAAAVGEGYSWNANDVRPTFRTAGIPFRLDYLLFRKNGLESYGAQTLALINLPKHISDHDPIYAKFRFLKGR